MIKKKSVRKLYQVYDLRTGIPISEPVHAFSEAQACGFVAVHIFGDKAERFYLEGRELTEMDLEDRCPKCGYYDRFPPIAQISCPNCSG